MDMSVFDQSVIDPNMSAGSMAPGSGKYKSTQADSDLRNDFMSEMGMNQKSPDMLTDEEKKSLESNKTE